MARERIRIEVLAGPVDREIPHQGEHRVLDVKIRDDEGRALLVSFTVTGEQFLRLAGGAELILPAQRDAPKPPARGTFDGGYLAGLKFAREYFGSPAGDGEPAHGAECLRAHNDGYVCTCDEAKTIKDMLR